MSSTTRTTAQIIDAADGHMERSRAAEVREGLAVERALELIAAREYNAAVAALVAAQSHQCEVRQHTDRWFDELVGLPDSDAIL